MTAGSVELVAVSRGPAGELLASLPDGLARLVAGWLISSAAGSPHTVRAYVTDITEWLTYCHTHGLDPLRVGKTDVDSWHRTLAQVPSPRTGRALAPRTRSRRSAAVASFYTYLVDEDVIAALPFRKKSRPKAPTDSPTVGLSAREAAVFKERLLSDTVSVRERAILMTLLMEGLRVSELTGLNVSAMRFNEDEVTLVVPGKGGKTRELALNDPVVEAIGEMLTERGGGDDTTVDQDEPLFATTSGVRYTRGQITRILKRVARAAGIRSWRDLSPHALRRSCATLLLDSGTSLHVVQDHLGHASADTTRRYDRYRGRVSRSAAAVYGLDRHIATAAARERRSRAAGQKPGRPEPPEGAP